MSGGHNSVVEHWWLKPGALGSIANFFIHLIPASIGYISGRALNHLKPPSMDSTCRVHPQDRLTFCNDNVVYGYINKMLIQNMNN